MLKGVIDNINMKAKNKAKGSEVVEIAIGSTVSPDIIILEYLPSDKRPETTEDDIKNSLGWRNMEIIVRR